MTDINAVRQYLEWAEEQTLAGNTTPTIEQYEEALRVADLEDRIRQVQEILQGPFSAEEALDIIGGILNDDALSQ